MHAEKIQQEFDEPLSWEPMDDRRASRIAILHGAKIDAPEADLDAVRDWAIDKLLRFKKVFGPRLGR
jgi:hypothetical protein